MILKRFLEDLAKLLRLFLLKETAAVIVQILRNNALISVRSFDKSSLFCQLVYCGYTLRCFFFDNIAEVYLNVAPNIAFCIAVFKSFPFFTRTAKFLKLLLNFRGQVSCKSFIWNSANACLYMLIKVTHVENFNFPAKKLRKNTGA